MFPKGWCTGVKVTVLDAARNVERSPMSNPEGYYVIPALPAGAYLIAVNGIGFQPHNVSNITLQVDLAPGNARPSSPSPPITFPVSARSSWNADAAAGHDLSASCCQLAEAKSIAGSRRRTALTNL